MKEREVPQGHPTAPGSTADCLQLLFLELSALTGLLCRISPCRKHMGPSLGPEQGRMDPGDTELESLRAAGLALADLDLSSERLSSCEGLSPRPPVPCLVVTLHRHLACQGRATPLL